MIVRNRACWADRWRVQGAVPRCLRVLPSARAAGAGSPYPVPRVARFASLTSPSAPAAVWRGPTRPPGSTAAPAGSRLWPRPVPPVSHAPHGWHRRSSTGRGSPAGNGVVRRRFGLHHAFRASRSGGGARLPECALCDIGQGHHTYEGFVEKFVGDAVLAVFGAPVAHEDDPERALCAALDMQAGAVELERRLGGQARAGRQAPYRRPHGAGRGGQSRRRELPPPMPSPATP